MRWQRANVAAAVNHLRELIADGIVDQKTVAVYEGLQDVLVPARRVARLRRQLIAAPELSGEHLQQRKGERRLKSDRRQRDVGPADGVERRSGRDRRSGADRRPRR
jgi:hypothetical protein